MIFFNNQKVSKEELVEMFLSINGYGGVFELPKHSIIHTDIYQNFKKCVSVEGRDLIIRNAKFVYEINIKEFTHILRYHYNDILGIRFVSCSFEYCSLTGFDRGHYAFDGCRFDHCIVPSFSAIQRAFIGCNFTDCE